jgi:hypothetical protein
MDAAKEEVEITQMAVAIVAAEIAAEETGTVATGEISIRVLVAEIPEIFLAVLIPAAAVVVEASNENFPAQKFRRRAHHRDDRGHGSVAFGGRLVVCDES